jgi:hypothetical protein
LGCEPDHIGAATKIGEEPAKEQISNDTQNNAVRIAEICSCGNKTAIETMSVVGTESGPR